jgi:hypothetical protein
MLAKSLLAITLIASALAFHGTPAEAAACPAVSFTVTSDSQPSAGGIVTLTWKTPSFGFNRFKVERQNADLTWSTIASTYNRSWWGADLPHDADFRVSTIAFCSPASTPVVTNP